MMERRFDMSDFEQSLKDHADQFVLVPSKRVWNGIYNNLHPGSKWPSITVAIVLLITLITLGNLNNSPKPVQKGLTAKSGAIFSQDAGSKATNNKDLYSENDISSKESESLNNTSNETEGSNVISDRNEKIVIAKKGILNDNSTSAKSEITTGFSDANTINSPKQSIANSKQSIASSGSNISDFVENSESGRLNNKVPAQNYFSIINISDNEQGYQQYIKPVNTDHVNGMNGLPFGQEISTNIDPNQLKNFQDNDNALSETFNSIKNELVVPVFDLEKNTKANLLNTQIINSKVENQTGNANAALHKRRKKNKNIEWTFYAAPLISNATFRGKGIEAPVNIYQPIVIYQTPSDNGMIYHAKLSFETGAKMTYSLSKKLKLVTGVNLNYFNYEIISNLLHPTYATLMFQDQSGLEYSKNYITYYGNGQSLNQVALTNYNLQVSIPVGLQYQIWGNKKIQINIESTVGPSLVLKSNEYIISADKRYYVNDPSLMRKINLGGNFGTFITFSARKVKWHIGPDIHYQLLSTYKNYYPIKEHLIDYGIRIGISK